MKKIFFAFAFASILWSCKTASSSVSYSAKEEVQVNINLNEIKGDKVLVTVKSPKIKTDDITSQKLSLELIQKIITGNILMI
jgi:hypothetical protein